MPELPWRKWFPQDWLSDPKLAHCSPATRGIWADAVSNMMLFCNDFVSGSDHYLARICRCSVDELARAHEELENTKVAQVTIQNGYKHWRCRRITRELQAVERKRQISEMRRQAVLKRWNKSDTKLLQNKKFCITNSVYASFSKNGTSTEEGIVKGRPKDQAEVEQFCVTIGLQKSDGEAMWLDWQERGYGKTKDWKAKIRKWKIYGYHPSQQRLKKNGNGAHPDSTKRVDPSKVDLPERFKSWAGSTYPDKRELVMKWKTWAEVPNSLRQEWWREEKAKLPIGDLI